MQISMTHTFDAPIEKVWAMFHDPASHVAKFETMGHHDVRVVTEEQTDDSLRIVITREVDIEGIPGFAKKFIKPRNTVTSDDHWEHNGPTSCGGRFTIDTKGVPMEIQGTTTATSNGQQTDYEVAVELKVSVPLIGGKLEGFGKGIVEKQLRQEFDLGDAWLASH
ncbi:MAG TPA: DUF2505 domain-containing protein [Microthrixaceae bacterium]|nr:DUF2505 domain-containing protein [Microthrixaceae bacterium]